MYKVIVVEDETMVRRGIILTIDWAALDCVIAGEAANGEEGAELAVRLSPDIIVTDAPGKPPPPPGKPPIPMPLPYMVLSMVTVVS